MALPVVRVKAVLPEITLPAAWLKTAEALLTKMPLGPLTLPLRLIVPAPVCWKLPVLPTVPLSVVVPVLVTRKDDAPEEAPFVMFAVMSVLPVPPR